MTPRASILMVAFLSEALLIAAAYSLAWIVGLDLSWNPSLWAVVVGACAAAPLLVGNHLLWRWTLTNQDTVYSRFSREVIVPLCSRVPPSHAFLIGILSGVGEEIFFRGAINLLLIRWGGAVAGLIISSVTFAWVHFIGTTKRYGGMIPLYTGVGAILWLVWFLTDSLTAAAATHATYNFLAIVWIRRLARRGETD